jgi:phosphoribosylformylglycinamidine synthase
LTENNIEFFKIGTPAEGETLSIKNGTQNFEFNIPALRDTWYHTSFLLDQKQSGLDKATERYKNYAHQPLEFKFPENFTGKLPAG